MATKSKKRVSEPDDLDNSNNNGVPQAKRAKTAKTPAKVPQTSSSTTAPAKTDPNGDPYWEISRMRRVTISTFKGRTMVNVREYYEKDGAELPGKKGISMPLDQFNAFVELLPSIEYAVHEKGGSVVRPEYDESANGKEEEGEQNEEGGEEEGESEGEDNEEGKEDAKTGNLRRNIDTTSDEDESE